MRKPLHNLEAERALLGTILRDNTALLDVGPVNAADFHPDLQRIARTIVSLIVEGREATPVNVRDRIGEAGERDTLAKILADADYRLEPVAEYAAIIHAHAVRRTIYQAARSLAKLALEPPEEAEAGELTLEAQRLMGHAETALQWVYGSDRFVSVVDVAQAVAETLRLPVPPGLRTGLSKLDRLFGGGLFAPDLVIVAGRPAMGKTALSDNLAVNVAEGGAAVGMFSMEMSAEQVAARVLSRRSTTTAKPFAYSSLRDGLDRPDPDHVAAIARTLPDTLLIDPTGAQTLAGVETSARDMRRRMGGLDLIIVDYLQLMRDPKARRDGRTQELTEITAGLKALAKRMNLAVVALSQLSREVEKRADKRPQLSDLRESGSIEQDADIVAFVYREHYYLERNPPSPRENEGKDDIEIRIRKHNQRLRETANLFEVYTGKTRHSGGGLEQLYCNLGMDVIADYPPDDWRSGT